MKQLTIIFACAAASIHALTAPPQLRDLKSNLKLKLRKQQLSPLAPSGAAQSLSDPAVGNSAALGEQEAHQGAEEHRKENARLREMMVELEEAAVLKSEELSRAREEVERLKGDAGELEVLKKTVVAEAAEREELLGRERARLQEGLEVDRRQMQEDMGTFVDRVRLGQGCNQVAYPSEGWVARALPGVYQANQNSLA